MQWISLELDGELSQLERVTLGRHLDACARCRDISHSVGAFTRLIREAPLVELDRPAGLAAQRRPRRRVRRVAVALAFAAVVAGAVIGGLLIPSGSSTPRSALAFRSVQEQQRFASLEARRLEPAEFVVVKPAVQSFAPRVLV